MLDLRSLTGEVLIFEGITLQDFLLTVGEVLSEAPPRWRRRHAGRPPFDPTSRVMALLVKERYGFTYREAEIYLKENEQTCRGCGMKNLPDHNTIWRTMTKLREPYLKQLNHEVNQFFKKRRNA
jgi:hypothetical protein